MPSNNSTASSKLRRAQKRARDDEEVNTEGGLRSVTASVTDGLDMLKRRILESRLSVTQRSLTLMWLRRHPSPYEALYQLLSAKPFHEDLLIAMDLAQMCGLRHHTGAMRFGGVKVDKPTPLLIALLSNRADFAELILKDSAFRNGSIDNSLALHWCVKVNNLDGIRLLAAHRADLNIKDGDGQSPLHLAAKNGNLAAVTLLISLGAFTNFLNKDSKTAWRLACEGGHKDVALLLVSKGAYPDYVRYGQYPLAKATAYGDLDLMRMMLQCGANVNSREVRNGYALSQAIIKHNLEAVLLLLDWGADVNIDAPLCLATCKNDSYEDSDGSVYDFNIDAGVYEYANYYQDEEHYIDDIPSDTFLAICEALISHGADINSKSFTGMTPLRIALNGKSSRRAKLLRAHGGNP